MNEMPCKAPYMGAGIHTKVWTMIIDLLQVHQAAIGRQIGLENIEILTVKWSFNWLLNFGCLYLLIITF